MARTQIEAKPEDSVSFVVLGRTSSGSSLAEMRKGLALDNVAAFIPERQTRAGIISELKARGFIVHSDDPSPVVSATGSLAQFQKLFKTKLARFQQDEEKNAGVPEYYCSVAENAPPPDASILPGALAVIPLDLPQDASSPRAGAAFHLSLPEDIARLTRADEVHKRGLRSGQPATGGGIRVAMLDSGFHPNEFYSKHGYRLRADRAADITDSATLDSKGHGTRQAANIFSCAPDAEVIGIKKGTNEILAFDRAAAHAPRVIVCSWSFSLEGQTELQDRYLALRLVVLQLLANSITMVFATGNTGSKGFPAMMPEVIAVGGVSAAEPGKLKAWDGSSSFISQIFRDRRVPDLCGLSSEMVLPKPVASGMELIEGGTSAAAPQVAGVAALLLQKNPKLTPKQIRDVLCESAKDVREGTTSTRDKAVPGPDLATGAGLLDASAAWNLVTEA